MNKALFTAILIFLVSPLFAQELNTKEVPPNVQNQMGILFPRAEKVQWFKVGSSYVADFFQDKTGMAVSFDIAANLILTETEMPESAIPTKAKEYLLKKYPEETIIGSEKITDNTKLIRWKVYIHNKELLFDNEGKFLKEMKSN